MLCPLKSPQYDVHEGGYPDTRCDMGECAWWEEHFAKCCIVVEAFLKGRKEGNKGNAVRKSSL